MDLLNANTSETAIQSFNEYRFKNENDSWLVIYFTMMQMVSGGNNGRCGSGGGGNMARGGMVAPRYPAPIGQRPHAPALPLYRAPPASAPRHHAPHQPRPNLYYHQHQRS